MVKSMTGFASHLDTLDAGAARFSCQWEMRAVNGRGLDLRFRLPDWLEGLEAALRKRLSARLGRGNVTLSLRLGRADAGAALRLNTEALDAALNMLAETEARAEARGFALTPIGAADVLALRGVIDQGPDLTDPAPLMPALMEQAEAVIDAFEAARAAEGAALAGILSGQIDAVAALLAEARSVLPERRSDQMQALRAALARLGEAAPQVEPARLEQELALIAMRGDVTEELDRLDAHVVAARALLAQKNGPVGRKFDFLMQEFNREANTLCAKSQHAALTRIGLDLKTVIDQMREQVQNVE
ncbi:MAG: YicC family protein [Pararhodobacter sp.]|nr:YicC family protein [Pararhodobacter sp.]